MFNQEFIEIVSKMCPNYRTSNLFKKENLKLKIEIIKKTEFLNTLYPNSKLAQRVWHIINNKPYIMMCPICHKNHIKWWDYRYMDACSNKCAQLNPDTKEKLKKTIREKYGVDYPQQSKEIRNKGKETFLKKYGTDHPWKNKDVLEKRKKILIEKYGVDNISKSKIHQDKKEKTFLERFGEKTPLLNKNIQEKIRQTLRKNHGVDYAQQSEKIKETTKRNNLKKYGVEHPAQTEEYKEKMRQIYFEKYGVYNAGQIGLTTDSIEKLNNKDWLIEQNKTKNMTQISKELGVSDTAVFHKFSSFNITPKNTPQESSFNLEFETYLKLLNVNYIKNDRTILKPLEIDFYLPDYKIGFELNGGYWHSENLGKDKNYHINKTSKCEERNIQLIQIFDFDWELSKLAFKGKIENLLKKGSTIYARKCIIKEISNKEERLFLNEHHIQKYRPSKIKYGLFYNDEILSVMTFSKPRFNKKYEWEIIRYATKGNLTIVGGASKLFNYFIKNHNPKTIISYGNRLFNVGNVYKILGFTFKEYTSPSYRYTNNFIEFFHRLSFSKKRAKEKLSKYDENKNEWENMKENGYYRIWDCGQSIWVWRNC